MQVRSRTLMLIMAALLAAPVAAGAQPKGGATKTSAASLIEAHDLRLIALLPMQNGYGPDDHDAYEAHIAPIAAAHGMVLSAAYTIRQFIGGPGPKNASTLGVWTLATPNSLEGVMGDSRYKNEIPDRNRMHDMQHTVMFVANEEPPQAEPEPGHALLVGVLAMKPGFGFQDHVKYERAIQPITARYGMKLVRSFRVQQTMGAGQGKVVAISLWDLPRPDALQEIMTDPEYVAHIGYRNLIHDMGATSMYFVAPRQ